MLVLAQRLDLIQPYMPMVFSRSLIAHASQLVRTSASVSRGDELLRSHRETGALASFVAQRALPKAKPSFISEARCIGFLRCYSESCSRAHILNCLLVVGHADPRSISMKEGAINETVMIQK